MRQRTWNPYLAGALAGVLLVLSVLASGHFLGASTTFARGASAIEKAVGIDPSRFEYFATKKGDYSEDWNSVSDAIGCRGKGRNGFWHL